MNNFLAALSTLTEQELLRLRDGLNPRREHKVGRVFNVTGRKARRVQANIFRKIQLHQTGRLKP